MSAESKGRRDQGTLCIRRAVHRGDGFCGLFGLHRLLSFENLRIQLREMNGIIRSDQSLSRVRLFATPCNDEQSTNKSSVKWE